MSGLGALIGLVLSVGLVISIVGFAGRRPLPISQRVAPYLGRRGDVAPRASNGSLADDGSTLGAIYLPLVRDVVRFIDRNSATRSALERRLASAGMQMTVAEFRLQQLTWVVAAGGIGLGSCLIFKASGHDFAVLPALIFVLISAGVGWLLRDYLLTRTVTRRRDYVRASLPGVAELLALAVASGESAHAALDRVGRTMHGPLADECARACDETSTGVGFIESLERMADRLDVVAVRRFVDGLSIAVSRGTPLADVLRAQAADARADRHRALLELAGRKEVLMLIPLVFLILPTVVLVALFPAMSALTSVTP